MLLVPHVVKAQQAHTPRRGVLLCSMRCAAWASIQHPGCLCAPHCAQVDWPAFAPGAPATGRLRAPIGGDQHVGATGNVRGAMANLNLTFHVDRSVGANQAVAQSPHPLPPLPPDLSRADRAQRASVLGDLDRSWPAAGIDDLRPAPLRDLSGRRLAVVAGKAKPTATLQVTA